MANMTPQETYYCYQNHFNGFWSFLVHTEEIRTAVVNVWSHLRVQITKWNTASFHGTALK